MFTSANKNLNALLGLALCTGLIASNGARVEAAESAADLFSSKCVGCHSIGGGDGVGPDLAATNTWTDSKLKTEVEKMAAMAGGLSEEEINSLVSYLKDPSIHTTESASEDTESKTSAAQPEEDLNIELPGSYVEGEMLFLGSKPLQNGGMSCIACHQSSSTKGLGPDLAGVSKKYKPRALVNACKQAPFKVMLAAYKNNKITETEAMHLAKYLIEKDKVQQDDKEKLLPIPVQGGALALACLAIIAIGYRNRNKSVRDKLKRK